MVAHTAMSGKPRSPDSNSSVITCKSHTDRRDHNSPVHTGPGWRSPSIYLHAHPRSSRLEAQGGDSGVWYPHPQGSVAQLRPTLWTVATRLLCPWSRPAKNTGGGYHSHLQGIFPTQGSNSGFPHYRQILYCLSHQGSPRKLEWVAYPFSRGSS